MITFEDVSFCYPDNAQPALHKVNLQISAGEFALLVGPSGAGKSTLLRLINGLVPHFSGGKLSGVVRVNTLDPVQATPRRMSREVGFVFQDPEAQFVMDNVEDELAFGLEHAGLSAQEIRLRVEEGLDLFELAPLRQRALDTLSGGERQRVAIAAALALRPAILVLDEPTSQLDPQSAEDVLTYLVRLNSDLGLTIVLAEHRLERVLPFVDRLIYLPGAGRELLTGDPRTVLRQIELGPPLVRLGKRLGWNPLPLTVKDALRFCRTLAANKPQPLGSPPRSPQSTAPVLQAHALNVSYGQVGVLHCITFDLWAGEIVLVMGRNGAGKSTLLKSLVGLIRPQQGRVTLAGQDLRQREVAAICRDIGYLPQDPNSLLFADTVRAEWLITLRNHGLLIDNPAATTLDSVDQLLSQLGLTDKAEHYPRDLSVGERQRVALGAIMITKPKVLLLDEPTRGLDTLAKARLQELLLNWRSAGIATILVTHDVEFAVGLADRVLLLSEGEVIATGTPQAILSTSPLFASQIARLFPGTGWLTVADVMAYWDSLSSVE